MLLEIEKQHIQLIGNKECEQYEIDSDWSESFERCKWKLEDGYFQH
jgi:hypothetical protein